MFDNAVEEIDLTDIALTDVYIISNKWAVQASGKYKGKFLDVQKYRGWTFKIGNFQLINGNWFYKFAFLTSNSHTSGNTPSYCSSSPFNAYIEVNNNAASAQWYEDVVPNDASYLYVYCYNADNVSNPKELDPDLFFIDPNPTSRIDRLVGITEGLPSIKADWFAVDGEPFDYTIPTADVGRKQTIGDNGNVFVDTGASVVMCAPKCVNNPVNGTPYTPTVSECYKIDELPNKVLSIKFNQHPQLAWSIGIVLYDASLSFISRPIFERATSADNWEREFDLSSYTSAKYFKLVFVHRDTETATDPNSLTLDDDWCEFVRQYPPQESMPDRVAALEVAVGNAAKNTIRVLQYNIGHFAMGMSSSSTISDQLVDAMPGNQDNIPPHSNYDLQLARWKSKIQNICADVMFLEEYSTVFGVKNGSNVNTNACGILDGFPYISVGTTNTSNYFVNALVSKYPLVGAAKVDLGSTSSSKAFMQVATIVINGVNVKVAACHLNWDVPSSRTIEMQNIIKYFAEDDHVIVCGDFNTDTYSGDESLPREERDYTPGANEFDIFLYGFEENGTVYAGGYTAANHGVLGNMPTFAASGSRSDRPEKPYCFLDNVLTKGFRMSNVVVIDDGNLTDHCGIMCDLTLV